MARCAVAALVGMGSYAATYRALDVISVPTPPTALSRRRLASGTTAPSRAAQCSRTLNAVSQTAPVRLRRLPLLQGDDEARTAVVVTGDSARTDATHGRGQLGHDGQTQPRSHPAVRAPVGAIEALEHPVQVARCDAGPVVVDRDDARRPMRVLRPAPL